MKKQLFGTLAIAVLFLASCGGGASGISDPKDIGNYAMDILKGVDGGSATNFADKFMSLDQGIKGMEDFDAMLEKSGSTKEEFMKKASEGRMKQMESSFKHFVEVGKEKSIDWKNITMDSFEPSVNEENKTCNGKLLVKSGDDTHNFNVLSRLIDGKYYVDRISGPM